MSSRQWTFCGLIGAFLDLAIAYFMLCGAAAVFFISKVLIIVGLYLPPPSQSVIFDPNGHYLQKISSVMTALRNSYPIDSLLVEADRRPLQSRSKSLILDDDDNDDNDDNLGVWSEMSDICNPEPVTREPPKSHPSPREKEKEIKKLKKVLQQERTSCSILSLELEKERTAAASAADEAMAMILRLQKEKANVEMEFKQFKRMVEEKNAYDEEEMNILKEIIFRRELENHVLIKENEMYRQMLQQKEGLWDKELDKSHPTKFMEAKIDQNNMNKEHNFPLLPKETIDLDRKLHREDHQYDCSDSHKGIISEGELMVTSLGEQQDIKTESGHNPPKMQDNDGEFGLEYHHDDKPGGWNREPARKHHHDESHKIIISEGELMAISKGVSKIMEDPNIQKMEGDGGHLDWEDHPERMTSVDQERMILTSVDKQRMILDAELEFLRHRLDFVQKGREKLNFSLDPDDKENFRLHLLEEITIQLHDLCQLIKSRDATPQLSEGGKTRPYRAARNRQSQSVQFGAHART